jgi:hypothetical protein
VTNNNAINDDQFLKIVFRYLVVLLFKHQANNKRMSEPNNMCNDDVATHLGATPAASACAAASRNYIFVFHKRSNRSNTTTTTTTTTISLQCLLFTEQHSYAFEVLFGECLHLLHRHRSQRAPSTCRNSKNVVKLEIIQCFQQSFYSYVYLRAKRGEKSYTRNNKANCRTFVIFAIPINHKQHRHNHRQRQTNTESGKRKAERRTRRAERRDRRAGGRRVVASSRASASRRSTTPATSLSLRRKSKNVSFRYRATIGDNVASRNVHDGLMIESSAASTCDELSESIVELLLSDSDPIVGSIVRSLVDCQTIFYFAFVTSRRRERILHFQRSDLRNLHK